MMDRRAFFLLGIAGACSLRAGDDVAWSPANKDLRIGLRLEKTLPPGTLVVYVENTGSTPKDLYVTDGWIDRFEFTAVDPGGKGNKIQDSLLYVPCAGLCGGFPLAERLAGGAMRKRAYVFSRRFYVPPSGPNTTLGKLLEHDDALQVSFEVTEQELKASHLSLNDPWLGRVVSGAVRTRSQN